MICDNKEVTLSGACFGRHQGDTEAPSALRISTLTTNTTGGPSKARQIKRPQANPCFLHNALKIPSISTAIAVWSILRWKKSNNYEEKTYLVALSKPGRGQKDSGLLSTPSRDNDKVTLFPFTEELPCVGLAVG